ncbi:hypothetical protein [uncultured Methanobrevibacter sp.]|nr:hypothetical protein [uncultured Methanobrevibacter sp.]
MMNVKSGIICLQTKLKWSLMNSNEYLKEDLNFENIHHVIY